MNCPDCRDLSPLYLSGELDPQRSAAFRAHLQACGSCAAAVDHALDVDSRLRAALAEQTPDTAALDGRIRRQIARASSRRWIKQGAAVAGLAAAVIIGLFTYRGLTSIDPACLAAVADHQREVTDGQRRSWFDEREVLEVLAAKQGIETSAIDRLSSTGLHLEHGKLCRLDGRIFLHLVYSDGMHRVSVFLRRHSGDASGNRSLDNSSSHASFVETSRLTAIVVGNDAVEPVRRLTGLVQTAL